MRLEQSFDVQAPLAAVWEALSDVQRVAPCLPGAEITEAGEDGAYHGTFKVKLGPTTAEYAGTLTLEQLDEETRTATMRADGRDKRGQGGAKATLVSRVREGEGGATRVEVESDFLITGRLARFGRGGMIQDVSNRLLREFASCLQAELAQPADRAAEARGEVGALQDTALGQDAAPVQAAVSPPVGDAAARVSPLPGPPREPLDAGSLVGDVIGDRVKEAAPLLLLALLLGFLLGRRSA